MSKAIHKYRKDNGMTLAQISAALKVNVSTVSRWEREIAPVPIERLIDVERLTGLSRRELRPDIFEGMADAS